VAAYFAAAGGASRVWELAGQDKCIEVWAFSRFANKWDDQPHINDWVERIRVPNALNNRMAAQRGCFTTLMVPPKKLLLPIDRRTADEVAIDS
jgi:hypothetical protein